MWTFLEHYFKTLAPSREGTPGEPERVTAIQAITWASPKCLRPDDICCQDTNAADWLATSCQAAAGTYRLDPDIQFPRTQSWIHIVLHSLKSQFVVGLLSTILPEDMTLRGYVAATHPDQFWVSCGLKEGGQPRQPRQPAGWGEASEASSTWRHRVVWLIPAAAAQAVELDHRASEKFVKVRSMWEAGTLHLLTAAPRSIGGRSRMTFAPRADAYGESLLLVLDYIGPMLAVFGCLRKAIKDLEGAGPSTAWLATGPVRAALNWAPGEREAAEPCSPGHALPLNLRCQNTLSEVIGTKPELPEAIDILDEQQAKILEALREANKPCHLVHALAGAGKSWLLQAILAICTKQTRQPGKFLLVTLRNRPLRHEFLETLLKNKILEPEEVLWGGGGSTA